MALLNQEDRENETLRMVAAEDDIEADELDTVLVTPAGLPAHSGQVKGKLARLSSEKRGLEEQLKAQKSKLAVMLAAASQTIVRMQHRIGEQLQTNINYYQAQKQEVERASASELESLRVAYEQREVDLAASLNHAVGQALEDVPHAAYGAITDMDLCPPFEVRSSAELGIVDPDSERWGNRRPGGFPVLVPLLNAGSVVVRGSADDPAVQKILRNLAAQALMSAPGGQVSLLVFSAQLKSALSGFNSPEASQYGAYQPVELSQEALKGAINRCVNHARVVEQSLAGKYATLADLVHATKRHEHPYTVLFIQGAPSHWDPEIVNQIKLLVAEGGPLGVSVVIQVEPEQEVPQGVNLESIISGCTEIYRHGRKWLVKYPKQRFQPHVKLSQGPSISQISQLMNVVIDAAKVGVLPAVPFWSVVDQNSTWMHRNTSDWLSSTDGMRVMLGMQGNEKISMELGNADSNIHHVLVGGRAGSGKTVLLKMIIYGLAACYNPNELRLFLLDFKEGVEFQQFAESGGQGLPLPHADVVSVASAPEFGRSVLAHFLDELKRRGELFRECGAENLQQYRRKTGKVLPRWVLVVDEFQRLLTGPHIAESVSLMEEITRLGRSFGLHLILASQTLAGIQFTGDKDRAIFENSPGRIVLPLSAEESKKFLSTENTAASELRYRGQAILNLHAGAPSENQQFMVGYGDEAVYSELQDELCSRWDQLTHKKTVIRNLYRGDRYTTAGELLERAVPSRGPDGEFCVWVGREDTIQAAPSVALVEQDAGGNVAVIGGSDTPSAIATTQVAAMSFLASAQDHRDVIVLDAIPATRREEAGIPEWRDTLLALGARSVEIFTRESRDEFLQIVKDYAANEEADHPALIVTLSTSNSYLNDRFSIPREFSEIIQGLPRKGVHWIGHWNRVDDVPSTGYAADLRKIFSTMVFVGSDRESIKDATGAAADAIPKPRRTKTIVATVRDGIKKPRSVSSIAALEEDDHMRWRNLR